MIQSDHLAGKRMRRRRGGANRLINRRRAPPAKVLATRISMSHLVPLLEFNLYNELVKSPEDRLALEKEIPALIAARDKAVTAAKRKQLQKETAQIPDHVAKMRR
jgi:hypothetical protein